MFHYSAFFGAAGAASMAKQMEAIQISNRASAALAAGRYDESIALHKQALELKLLVSPDLSVKTGITYNGLGEALLRAGRLDEADEALSKALKIREKEGPVQDIASTRDNMGQLREAQGRFAEAREVRLRGAAKKLIMCGNYDCPTHAILGLNRLSACGACESVFYCSKDCQKRDWIVRHKVFCQAHTAASQSNSPPGTQLNSQSNDPAESQVNSQSSNTQR
ncbi:uncharacterized protein GGS22DRAFT_196000 [Annulohypoxylon maeteangense]|uniref:uncharacterized protein n=1 Tax=Annulohypoxylon maeteangense TaxID=1927788 RepID=UPI00200860A8|nr:uncharacterized protein GGS22DRAFT_196000 [Annulohypoxylon maeteangense]KAI0882264.1 hypothetical protein GGS22DRAFT_196000 [Annulohypoxylon maeteangense]